MSKILIIDDEASIRDILSGILEDEGYVTLTAPDGTTGLDTALKEEVELIFLDLWLPGIGGMEVLTRIKEVKPDVEVIIISGHANVDTAVKAIKSGAFDCLEKPLDMNRILTLTRNALKMEHLKKENRSLKRKQYDFIGESPGILQVKQFISQIAPTESTVLLLGENGTGKEVIARSIHNQSKRSSGPFVEVNCAAIPESLIESELFGHEKGAFTGASGRRKGKFEAANGGTLFLDEIADMSQSAQAKVLRAIQESRFERIGGNELVQVDIRIIAATNKNILQEIQKGNFREDLYFRISVFPLNIPPLRERGTDIPLLTEYFMESLSKKNGRKKQFFTEESLTYLSKYHWPGNVRELKNFTERISIMVDSETVSREDVKQLLNSSDADNSSSLSEFTDLPLPQARDSFEKHIIELKLKENGGNISRTAQALGIYASNLHSKIKKYGIDREK